MSSMFLRSPLVLAVAFALSACSLAPKYERPDSPVPAQFPLAQQGQADAAQAADLGWREFFTDPRLHALIEQAVENNRDLRIATQRIEEARAQYGVARSDQLPSIGVQAAQQATHTPAELRP
ncbi:TolC family protein, partial [Alcaligenes pakistanensis]